MPTTLKRNVVSRTTISATPTLIVYDDWKKVPKHLTTENNWRNRGRGIRAGETPIAYMLVDSPRVKTGRVKLYSFAQTRFFQEPKESKWLLIDKFVPKNEKFGLRPIDKSHPIQRQAESLWSSVGELVYSSFNYKHRRTGIPVRFRGRRTPTFADALYVLANSHTNWFVLDLDNHFPTIASTKAHLLLVNYLVKRMPEIVKLLGGGSVFYDYAQASPRGIHIWVHLNRKTAVKALHESVRRILNRLADPALDAMLKKNGLKAMGSLEILPTEGQLIRMFGTYDRRVFTTRELKPKNKAFDAESLLEHIRSKTTNGDPSVQYARRAIDGLGNDLQEAPTAISVPPAVLALGSTAPSQRSGYFSRIVEACLNGVTEPDVLYEGFLSPLARALYFREFHDQPDRMRLTLDALVRWIDTKHNGLVTRINSGHRREVISQIRQVVKKLPRTPSGIRTFWDKVVANDLAYPRQKVSLVACIDSQVVNPVQVTKASLKRLPALLGASGGTSTRQYTYNGTYTATSPLSLPSSLPPLLETHLRKHLQTKGVRKGKSTERIILFTLNLLNEMGLDGTRTICEARLNQLAGLGKGRSNVGRYKKFLRGAGILKPGWEKTYSKVKKIAARYDLTPWALGEVRTHWNTLAPASL